MDTAYYFFPIIFVWTMNAFFQKKYIKYLNTLEILYIKHLIYTVYFIIAFFYILFNKKKYLLEGMKNYSKLPLKIYIQMVIMVFLSFLSAHSTFVLLKKYDVSYFLPMVRGGSSILVLFVSYFIYKESITINKLIGFILIVIGIFIMNIDINSIFKIN